MGTESALSMWDNIATLCKKQRQEVVHHEVLSHRVEAVRWCHLAER